MTYSTEIREGASAASDSGFPPDGSERQIDIIDVLIVVVANLKKLLIAPILVAVLTYGLTFLLPRDYAGVARVMPSGSQASSSASNLMAQLGTIVSIAGLTGTVKNPSDIFAGLVKSNTVLDAVIKTFKLKNRYNEDTLVDTREALLNRVSVTTGTTDGILTIEVLDNDPTVAAEIANKFASELDKLTMTLAAREARTRRVLFESELKRATVDLTRAEHALQIAQETTGLISVDEQAQSIIQTITALYAQISAKEVQLAAIRSYATDSNPVVVKTLEELKEMRAALNKAEKTQVSGNGNIFIATKNVPAVALESVRKLREVKLRGALVEALTKNFEIARIDELSEPATVQIVDRAIPLDKEARPLRLLIAAAAFTIAGFLALVWAFGREALRRYRLAPETSGKIELLISKFPRFGRPTT